MKTNLKQVGYVMVLAAGLGVHTSASALIDPFYDNLSNFHDGLEILGADQNGSPDGHWAAASFSNDSYCSPKCTLDSITLRLTPNAIPSNTTSQLSLSIYSSFDITTSASTGFFTGTPLSVPITTTAIDVIVDNPQDVTFTPDSAIELEDGMTYWAVLNSDESGLGLNWRWWYGDDSAVSESHFLLFQGYVWSATDDDLAMRVTATPLSAVPIPGAFWLMGSALLGFVLKGRRGV